MTLSDSYFNQILVTGHNSLKPICISWGVWTTSLGLTVVGVSLCSATLVECLKRRENSIVISVIHTSLKSKEQQLLFLKKIIQWNVMD